jgi:hypothetical protein
LTQSIPLLRTPTLPTDPALPSLQDAVKKAEATPSLKTNWETIKSLTDLVPLANLPEAK